MNKRTCRTNDEQKKRQNQLKVMVCTSKNSHANEKEKRREMSEIENGKSLYTENMN